MSVAMLTKLEINKLAPGQLKIILRDGNVMPFNSNKINVAITKAFLEVEGDSAKNSSRIHTIVEELTNSISLTLHKKFDITGSVHIEDIQDQVELVLMRAEQQKVARAYVLYREARRKIREQQQTKAATNNANTILVTMENGKQEPLDVTAITKMVTNACANLENVTPKAIISDALKNLFSGVHIADVYKSITMTARALIEQEPDYSFVAARLLLHTAKQEISAKLKLAPNAAYADYLTAAITAGISFDILDSKLQDFDLKQLGAALKPERDAQFTYLSMQTLYDRYFLHNEEKRFEMPQVFFMRIAMGLSLEEADKNARAIEFYNLLSSFDFMSSTPTLFNSGTTRSQLSSCYLTTIPDDLYGIYSAMRDNAMLSKWAGGLGNDWTPVRAMGARIKGTNGHSQGSIPFMKIANDTAVAVNQGGKRKGVACGYLETWHLDIEEFLELRKNTGDERRRTHDMNTANWVPDLFMQRVMEKGDWTLFSPNDTPDLHEIYGDAFNTAYVKYEQQAKAGKIKNHKVVPALTLWRKMLGMIFETGHPWITFKDPCNLRSPQQHVGTVHSSNLCTEITLNTSVDEIAVCNLGSVNLARHITKDGKLDVKKLETTINTAIRMLDNVININYYSVIQARRSNLKHRPIGMGIMGFQDALYQLNIPYSSETAVEFADRSMEQVSYFAITASTNLAEERGTYETFEGSLWSKGILPIDSINNLQAARGAKYLEQDRSQSLNWEKLRQRVRTVGMRNSNVLAIAPTATIANICNVSQSIEPTFQNLFVKSNLSGEFTIVNPYLVTDLKKLDMWDSAMVNDLKYFNGSLQNIERIPENLRRKYQTVFEIDAKWLIDAASRRQKWIDQSQSLNLYISQPSGKKLDEMYSYAWLKGLKTTYYLRSLGATDAEKSTINRSSLNAVNTESTGPNLCAIDDPECEACQ